ncbi:MAG TPA: cellulase family glycosylhydrolase [Bryobacteraceae bacterium]|nr:cellulase family glycosylhydrolase [Bryobacteraceae bacterium]
MRKTALLTAIALASAAISSAQGSGGFVGVANGALTLNNAPFRFGGTNSYALMQESQTVVEQVLGTAAANHFTGLRMWGFTDVASSANTSFYLQNFSGGSPQFNDGVNGLANVDYAIYKAGQLGLKLIVTLTNNWTDYGGMDTYSEARGLQYHDQFYTDPTVIQWYENWVSHVLNHVNTISGVAYKNDPTIMIWELANEPRCQGSGTASGGLPSSGTCNPQSIVSWISTVSAFLKSIDSNHLVAIGDEGFFCNSAGVPASLNICYAGVDSVAFSQVPGVDVVGFHLYPDTWSQTAAWGEQYITQHIVSAKAVGKPVYMGEFGILEGNIRNSLYDDYTNLILQNGGSGALFWDLLAGQPSPANSEALSSFDLEAGSPILSTVGNFAQTMAGQGTAFPPVAGDQWAQGVFGDPVTLNPMGNAVAFGGASIDPKTIDLDPNTPGVQSSISVYAGTFAVVGQSVQFTPSSGFNGVSICPYTLSDTKGSVSNVAYLIVTVPASPTGTAELESFETGTDGWGALAESYAIGTVSQTTAFHTDGSYGLAANVTQKGWFGAQLSSPVDLTGRPSMSVDVQLSAAGLSGIAFQSGAGAVWCQNATLPTVPANTTTTVTLQLQASQLQCFPSTGSPTLSDVTALYVWLPNIGTDYIDNLRAAPVTTPPPPPTLPTISSVSNSAGYQAGAASGSYFSIYGNSFLPANAAPTFWSGWIVNGNLPASLGGISVTIGGQAAYLYYASPTQINAVAPLLTPGPAQVVVTTSAGNSAPFSITAANAQPAFFPWPGGFAVATHLDYSYAVPNGTFSVTTKPASPGETIVLWGTGFGNTTPLAPVGQEVPPSSYAVSGVSVTIGNTPAQVYGTALAPGLAGLYQVAIQVPASLPGGTYNLVATVNGVQSPPLSFAVQ